MPDRPYRTRLAPTPTGYLHLGHARTFRITADRARARRGGVTLRIEDLDKQRSKREFVDAAIEDLRWLGCDWDQGPLIGGPFAPYTQSERFHIYEKAFEELKHKGLVYPCFCSRKDILTATQAPHRGEDEWIYPNTCRPNGRLRGASAPESVHGREPCWRFRTPEHATIEFEDGRLGRQAFVCGVDFGDFVVWRNDGTPSYQLAVTVDDALMEITEVIRGEDLLISTARQLLLYQALERPAPSFYHCELVADSSGRRLAKRVASLSLHALRASGITANDLPRLWSAQPSS